MDSEEERQLLLALEEWAMGHPQKERPFLILMGRSYTPEEYYREVKDNEDFRSKLFRFLSEQAERSHEKPLDMIIRAVEANRL